MIATKNLAYEYEGGRQVFSGVSFNVNEGDKIGVVGNNGTGKTTLLNILAGEMEPTAGTILRNGMEIGYMPQHLEDWVEFRVSDFLLRVSGVEQAYEDLEKSSQQLAEGMTDQTMVLYERAQQRVERIGNDFGSRMEAALRRAGIADDVDVDAYIGELSGGQKTKLALAATFASTHDVVLLDEPTNNLDSEGIVVLEKYIKTSKASFVIVSHDRRFLRNSVSTIMELLGGDKGVKTYGLGYDEYIDARENARDAAFRRYEEHEQEVGRLRSTATAARRRANGGATGRRRDNDKLSRNAAVGRGQSSAARAARRAETRINQLQERRPDKPEELVEIDLDFGHETGNKLSSALGITDAVFSYPGSSEQFGPYNLSVGKNERVLLSGKNGVGKSTLIRAIFNPDMVRSGSVNVAKQSNVGYMDQDHSLPHMGATAADNIMALCEGIERAKAVNLLVKFNISKDTFDAPVTSMSPGERAKVLLAAIAYNQPDLLVLDEPTNHLDIPSIEAMEIALRNFKGALLLVSHDREFCDTVGINRSITLR